MMAAHETDSVSTPSEKTGYANDTIDIARSNSKTEAADENGEVFQQAEYRALGWSVIPSNLYTHQPTQTDLFYTGSVRRSSS